MLTCNIVEQIYNQIKREQFGICFDNTTLLSMAQKQLRYNLNCEAVILCYTPDECESTTPVACNLILSQANILTTCTAFTLTQNFNI